MPNNINRIKQFMPFDALKGFKEELSSKEKIIYKKVLSIDEKEKINEILKSLKVGDNITIKYIHNKKLNILTGTLNKINVKQMWINDKVVNIVDMVKIILI